MNPLQLERLQLICLGLHCLVCLWPPNCRRNDLGGGVRLHMARHGSLCKGPGRSWYQGWNRDDALLRHLQAQCRNVRTGVVLQTARGVWVSQARPQSSKALGEKLYRMSTSGTGEVWHAVSVSYRQQCI